MAILPAQYMDYVMTAVVFLVAYYVVRNYIPSVANVVGIPTV